MALSRTVGRGACCRWGGCLTPSAVLLGKANPLCAHARAQSRAAHPFTANATKPRTKTKCKNKTKWPARCKIKPATNSRFCPLNLNVVRFSRCGNGPTASSTHSRRSHSRRSHASRTRRRTGNRRRIDSHRIHAKRPCHQAETWRSLCRRHRRSTG